MRQRLQAPYDSHTKSIKLPEPLSKMWDELRSKGIRDVLEAHYWQMRAAKAKSRIDASLAGISQDMAHRK